MKVIIPPKFTKFKKNRFMLYDDPENITELKQIIRNINNEYIFNVNGAFSSGNNRKSGHFNSQLLKYLYKNGKYVFNVSNFVYYDCFPNGFLVNAEQLDYLEYNFDDVGFIYMYVGQSPVKAKNDMYKKIKINTNVCDYTISFDNDNTETLEICDNNSSKQGKFKKKQFAN